MFRRSIPPLLLSFLFLSTVTAEEKTQTEAKPKAPVDKAKAARAQAAFKELLKFQGTWTVVSQEMNGKAVPASDFKGRTMFFGGEAFILRKNEEILQIGVQKVDPGKSPPTVNAAISKGLYQGETMLGIYAFEDDTLKVCFDIEGQNRPGEFKSAEGEGRFVTVYRRVPPKTDEADPIVGRYESVSIELDGKEHKADAEITRQGDAYLVRYTKGDALAYLGIGIRKGNVLAVTWANRGEVGLSVYKIEKDGRLLGDYTQLGAIGIVNKENLTPKKPVVQTKAEQ